MVVNLIEVTDDSLCFHVAASVILSGWLAFPHTADTRMMGCGDLGGSDSCLSHMTMRVNHGCGHVSLFKFSFAFIFLPRERSKHLRLSVFSHRVVVSTAAYSLMGII